MLHGSYLQGMETKGLNALGIRSFSTDPTYKEWKLWALLQENVEQRRTDPTYKEWKPLELVLHYPAPLRTDPTYKEWKPVLALKTVMPSNIKARILPTRNGNAGLVPGAGLEPARTDPTYKEWKPLCLNSLHIRLPYSTDPTYKEWKRTMVKVDELLLYEHGSYLQGMETHQDARKRNAPLLARILPTRNGNGKKVSGILRMIGGTDPTYKEWKRTEEAWVTR